MDRKFLIAHGKVVSILPTASTIQMEGNLFHLTLNSSEFPLGIIHLVRTKIFRKSNVSYPLIRTQTYAYQGVRNVSFSQNFA